MLLRYSARCWDKCIMKSSTRTHIQRIKRLSFLFSPVLTIGICCPCETCNVLCLLRPLSNNHLRKIVKDGVKYSANPANTERTTVKNDNPPEERQAWVGNDFRLRL